MFEFLKLPTFWLVPEKIQKLIIKSVKPKQCWELTVFYQEPDWAFHMPPFIWNEGLVGPTAKELSWWYEFMNGKKPHKGAKVKLKVSSEKFDGAQAKIFYVQDDPLWLEASEYWDSVSEQEVWLCPVLQVFFGHKPEHLWFSVANA